MFFLGAEMFASYGEVELLKDYFWFKSFRIDSKRAIVL